MILALQEACRVFRQPANNVLIVSSACINANGIIGWIAFTLAFDAERPAFLQRLYRCPFCLFDLAILLYLYYSSHKDGYVAEQQHVLIDRGY